MSHGCRSCANCWGSSVRYLSCPCLLSDKTSSCLACHVSRVFGQTLVAFREISDQQKRGSSGKWSDATWTHGKQLEQLLQQDTTLRGDNRLFEAHADIRLAAMETTMNNASPGQIRQGMSKAKRCFLLFTSQQDITREACRLLQVVKVVLVVFLPQQGILLTILAIPSPSQHFPAHS